MRRPLFVLCLLATACIWIGCRLHIFPDGREQVSEARELLLWQEVPILQGRVCEKDTEAFYVDHLQIINATISQEGEYQSIQESSPESLTISQKIQIKCEYSIQEHGEQPKLGSNVLVTGEFIVFSTAGNPGQFDALDYYDGQNICGSLKACSILQESAGYSRLWEGLSRLRMEGVRRINTLLPAREASVLNTILLGEKQGMDGEWKELYRSAGILHIASISGLHVMLIAMFLYQLLRRFGMPLGPACIISCILLVLYGIMTGMSTSAVRAIAMFLIRMLGKLLGRTYDMLTALALVGVAMVINHPLYLQDAGFLLSFGAVLGIGILCPSLKKREEKRLVIRRVFSRRMVRIGKRVGRNLTAVRDSFYSCVAVNLMLLPILLWYYYEVPVYSIVLNLLIIPSLSVLAAVGFGLMLVPGLALLAPLEEELLQLYAQLCLWTLQWPGHTWNPGRPEAWSVAMYYLLLLVVLLLRSNTFREWCKGIGKGGTGKCVLRYTGPVTMGILLVGIFLLSIHPRENRVTFLDVGQGDCICVETASGQVYLFDCGSSSNNAVGQYVLKPYLKYYGIHHIEALFLSHPDQDHCSGALELLDRQQEWGISVGQVILPEITLEQRRQEMEDILSVADCPVTYVSAGDSVVLPEIKLLCLHPREGLDYEDGNQYSQCFYLELGKGAEVLTVLLTGDVEGAGEGQLLEALIQYGISQVDVLKVAHHGSKNGTSKEFLEQINAKVAVISCGERNIYGHPHKETLQRLKEDGMMIVSTGQCGAVTVTTGSASLLHRIGFGSKHAEKDRKAGKFEFTEIDPYDKFKGIYMFHDRVSNNRL